MHQQLEFVTKAKASKINVNRLVALPGTPLYQRVRNEGRLRDNVAESYSLSFDGPNSHSNIVPRLMTPEQLDAGCGSLIMRLYDPEAFAVRLLCENERTDRVRPCATYFPGPLVPVGLLWLLVAYLADPHRRALLRAFWQVVPRALVRHRRVLDFALVRLADYRNLY